VSSRKKKGIVGIEAAIVLIAFVIVAAALAFVALNMGLFTTQRSKEVIGRGLGEASSALLVDGSVIGNVSDNQLTLAAVPVKLSTGQQPIDLIPGKASVRLVAAERAYENVLNSTCYFTDASTLKCKWGSGDTQITGVSPTASIAEIASKITTNLNFTKPAAVFVIHENVNPDTVLEAGEKAILLLWFNPGLQSYQKFTAEIRVAVGAPLIVERTVPPTLPSAGGSILMD